MTAHHDGWLVPVRRDLDGTILVLCVPDYAVGTPTDGWALWCASCRAVVTGTLPGTEGLGSVEDLPDDLADAVYQSEGRLAAEHAAAMTAQPEPVGDPTVRR